MIKCKHIKCYKTKLRDNKVKYGTADVLYITTQGVKVPFSIPEFSSSKIITHQLHVDNARGDEVIRYDMIIGSDLMVKLGLKA